MIKDDEQIPSIEEIQNSKRWFKSATPKQTLDWYVKWVASCLMICAMSVRGVEGLLGWDLGLSFVGVIGWLWVSILWKDRALILVNGLGLMLLSRNLIEYIS